MSDGGDIAQSLCAQVREALAAGTPLAIRGGNSKPFYGEPINAAALEVAGHTGIVNYQPTELVISARAGTPLRELETTLLAEGQMLPFEPPHLGEGATLGGTVACALSGPRRPWSGALRDLVLGTRLINGRGELLRFGGEVMKNVAGYDISRLLAGSLGTLGVIAEVSLKVLPAPQAETTRVLELDAPRALRQFRDWCRLPLPLSGLAHWDGRAYVRLSGSEAGVAAARERIGGEAGDGGVWRDLREQALPFFAGAAPALWRISVPPATPALELEGAQLIDWAGGLRWLRGPAPAAGVRAAAAAAGGHASCFRGAGATPVFHPLAAPMLALHKRVKQALDPAGIFNPGRMYREL